MFRQLKSATQQQFNKVDEAGIQKIQSKETLQIK
jgi:hypothetical protein